MVNNNYIHIKRIKEYAIENKIPIMQNEGIDFLTTFTTSIYCSDITPLYVISKFLLKLFIFTINTLLSDKSTDNS